MKLAIFSTTLLSLVSAQNDTCHKTNYQKLMGAIYNPKQGSFTYGNSALNAKTLPQNIRVLGPDDMFTTDYRPERINIFYKKCDHTGAYVVKDITCVCIHF
ncbi:hypothetical protein CONCODRAFT_11639 [Conidiobolus coronatus NRRL 28638]|uniref:Uncharacterized protein n=1 Tax=Conidiobolus coronatus (strain ATCC 28846 / CBS 209.66 / NRRL 28638) TaxID=796925 RepID=A0A137NV05_CONC2|nr:hypothetical protein CONCODRAFT_11639 [Conidiobolus coronatus NRRL 28638]|eukprot:KXN66508.1 hypothetical protein CONCODRAFT_11639 [Conidiobolus coronatus NRRL 28638]